MTCEHDRAHVQAKATERAKSAAGPEEGAVVGWAVGENAGRHIGYGVPAVCEQPDCSTNIDRGLAYACGGGAVGAVENCGRFFCAAHLTLQSSDEDGATDPEFVCERCATGQEPFDRKPDTPEWASHVLTDDSWAQWRQENPARVATFETIASAAHSQLMQGDARHFDELEDLPPGRYLVDANWDDTDLHLIPASSAAERHWVA